jgi:hypothetical protein
MLTFVQIVKYVEGEGTNSPFSENFDRRQAKYTSFVRAK